MSNIAWRGPNPYKIAFTKASQIHNSRREVYSDVWACMSIESLLYAAIFKLERARFTEEPEKKLDDILDAFNYIVFTIARLNK